MKTEAAELAIASAASKSAWGGALIGFVGWLTSTQGVGLVGVLVAVAGVLVSTYYKRKADSRHIRESAARVALDEQRLAESRVRTEVMRVTGRPLHADACETSPAGLGDD